MYAAYDRCKMENLLKAQYGFGMDDIEYRNGSLVGKTDEIQEVIDSIDFKGKLRMLILIYSKGTREHQSFQKLYLSMKTGNFKRHTRSLKMNLLRATNSSALMAKVKRELAEKEAILENGRAGDWADSTSGILRNKMNAMFQQLTQGMLLGNNHGTRFWSNPIGRELAKQVILSNDELLSKISAMMMDKFSGAVGKDNDLFLPMNYMGVDVKAILLGDNEAAIDQVMMKYALFLGYKARTVGLTKMEQYFRNH